MARSIPSQFNYLDEDLDENETLIRDTLKLSIENWAKFRYAINIGIDSSVLSAEITIDDKIKQAYRELGKSHYEVVTSLGNTHLAFLDAEKHQYKRGHILFTKPVKEFYFHIGILLDNLARLIYLINHPKAAKEYDKRGFVRHYLDWGQVRQSEFATKQFYNQFFDDLQVVEILNIRNNLAHNWFPIPMKDENNIQILPLEIRNSRNYLWPFEERTEFDEKYKNWVPVICMLQNDLGYIDRFQSNLFGQLIINIYQFEKNNNVIIN
ncbi:MAG: hypothetical protein JJE09_00060 [Bacteroidia bacterium]|nr:hypothetical protein [Bacteroidia bacterium]